MKVILLPNLHQKEPCRERAKDAMVRNTEEADEWEEEGGKQEKILPGEGERNSAAVADANGITNEFTVGT